MKRYVVTYIETRSDVVTFKITTLYETSIVAALKSFIQGLGVKKIDVLSIAQIY